jgi:hypothetical protein
MLDGGGRCLLCYAMLCGVWGGGDGAESGNSSHQPEMM